MAKQSKTPSSPSPRAKPETTRTLAAMESTQQRSLIPSDEQIARRAYELYLARGGEHGRHLDDWHQAESELRQGRA